jgi:hypothetical protein
MLRTTLERRGSEQRAYRRLLPTQNPVPLKECRFESDRGHQSRMALSTSLEVSRRFLLLHHSRPDPLRRPWICPSPNFPLFGFGLRPSPGGPAPPVPGPIASIPPFEAASCAIRLSAMNNPLA